MEAFSLCYDARIGEVKYGVEEVVRLSKMEKCY